MENKDGVRFLFMMLFGFTATLGINGMIHSLDELTNCFIAMLSGEYTYQIIKIKRGW